MGDDKLTIYVQVVNDPTHVTGRLKNNNRVVMATVPEAEGRRLLKELATASAGFTGQEGPKVEVTADNLVSISD